MTTPLVIAAIVLLGLALLAYIRKRRDLTGRSAFEHAVRAELQATHRRMLREMEETGRDPEQMQADFQERAQQIMHFFGEQYYGDESGISPGEYASIQRYTQRLQKQFRKKVRL